MWCSDGVRIYVFCMVVCLPDGADVMSNKRSKNPRRDKIMKQIRAQRGLDRAEFIANGGEMVRWRGLRLVQQNKKKQANKTLGRKKVRL